MRKGYKKIARFSDFTAAGDAKRFVIGMYPTIPKEKRKDQVKRVLKVINSDLKYSGDDAYADSRGFYGGPNVNMQGIYYRIAMIFNRIYKGDYDKSL